VVSASLPSRLTRFLPATAAVVALLAGSPALAREAAPSPDVIARSALPSEAMATERLIRSGGPFPYAKDGTVFGNRERLLPRHPRGYWREYTVPTPGVRHRGARRIVCGGTPPTAPEACYYSADHYASFQRIAP
jgi:ribonuclease T1